LPINIIPTECTVCGEETTIYIRGEHCENNDVFILTCACIACEKRKTAEKSNPSNVRSDEAVGEGGNESGDVVCQEEERQHHVYELIDHRDDSVFYIGVTMNPRGREYDHGAPNSESAALPRIQEIRQSGSDYHLRIVASFDDRQRAEAYETILINQTSGIVNRFVPKMRCVP
jgi:predicted GIY-YIG superfamily endonuclease